MRIDKNAINKIRKVETVGYKQNPYTITKVTVNGVEINYSEITNFTVPTYNSNK